MVQKLVIYPDERINHMSTDVRSFNQTLWDVIEDMQDTMTEHHLNALAAIQIAYPYNIVLMKQGTEYKEYINPRIIKEGDKFDSTETTLYYPNATLTVPRFGTLTVVYEDRHGQQQYETITDRDYATTFQRKVDYTFGGTLLDKVSKEQRERILDTLATDGYVQEEEICPAFSKKDYFVSFTDKLLFIMGLTLLSPLFNFSKETLDNFYTLDKVILPVVILLMVGFFFYAQYEAKLYRQCSSCQVGNNIGVIVKRVSLAVLLAIGSYFLVNPN